MKRKIIIISCIIVALIIGIVAYFNIKEKNEKITEKAKQERYSEIRKNVIKGVEWNIHAMYPNCPIVDDSKGNGSGAHYNSSFLIENGYIKKSDLLDYDEKSYCDIYVRIYDRFEDELDHQHNCYVSYKLYLKCNGYEEKGYFDWGD